MNGRERLEARAYELYIERYHRHTLFIAPSLETLRTDAIQVKLIAARWMACLLAASDELFKEAQS